MTLTLPFHVDPPSAAAAGDEHAIQSRFVRLLPARFVGVRVIAIANAGERSVVTGARMRAEGMAKGAADTCIVWGDANVAWIEFKKRTGSLSDEQKAHLAWLHSRGHRVAVCRHWETAFAVLEQWGAPRWSVAA